MNPKIALGTIMAGFQNPNFTYGIAAPAAMAGTTLLADKIHGADRSWDESLLNGAMIGALPYLSAKGLHAISPTRFSSNVPNFAMGGLVGTGLGTLIGGSNSLAVPLASIGGTLAAGLHNYNRPTIVFNR